MLGISISLNAISTHGTCTAVFVVVAAIIGFVLGSIQTLHEVSWLAWVGATSILTASKSRTETSGWALSDNTSIVFTLTVAVGVQDKPAAAPPGPFKSNWKGVNDPSFEAAISACSSIVFAWAGTPAFFQIASEMRVPEDYTKSLLLCQSIVATTYIVIGVVVYYYCGSFVASPALGSAGVLLKKVCYGLALPGLCVSTLLFVHVSSCRWDDYSRWANHSSPDRCKICFCPHVTRVLSSYRPYFPALGHLVGMHIRHDNCLIHHRECNSCLWESSLAYRCTPRHTNVLPTNGRHVAIRQLAQ